MTTHLPSAATAHMSEIADDVYAYVQPDGGWCVNNAGLVAAGGTSVLIDTAATEHRARRLRDAVAAVDPSGPSVLVNTHHHGDHVFGNAQFRPATIVAHERCRTEMIESGQGLRQLWPGVDWGETPIVPPTLTFRDRIELYAGDLRLELIHVGPAHTTNDVVVWIPDRRVLFAGDVVMNGVTPFCLMGSIEGSLQAVRRLRELRPEVVVSGHGAVGGADVFDVNEEYLTWVQQLAAAGASTGRTPVEVARGADLGAFAALIDPERLVGNLHRAYRETAGADGPPLGAPVDILAGFQDMVAYHGGLPDCHA